MNIEDHCFWNFIPMDFAKFEIQHFNELDNITMKIIQDCCYLHSFWIDYIFSSSKIYITFILKDIDDK